MIAGLVLGAMGLALILIAAFQFRHAKTHLEPWKPSTSLVTGGVYRFTRNPIYLGMALGYAGLSLLADSLIALAGLPLVLAIMHYGVIKREEHYLAIRFGQDYRDYQRRIRRWI